jgi:hypothetical protein
MKHVPVFGVPQDGGVFSHPVGGHPVKVCVWKTSDEWGAWYELEPHGYEYKGPARFSGSEWQIFMQLEE